MTPDILKALKDVGQSVTFAPDEVLRQKGDFAPDMLLITKGRVDCILPDVDATHVTVGPDTIVGEIGFLTGQGATATLRALGPVEALSLDASALQRLQRQTPAIAADVLRHLARLLQNRSEQNATLMAETSPEVDGVEVLRCSTLDQRRIAQRLRYDVQCLENGRVSEFADRAEGTIADDLDSTGTSFIATLGGQAIGTMRVNFGRDREGVLPGLYSSADAQVSLEDRAFISATAIPQAYQTAPTIRHLIAAIATFAEASGTKVLFADCAPEWEGVYNAIGFRRSAANFVHADRGVSVPMALPLGGAPLV